MKKIWGINEDYFNISKVKKLLTGFQMFLVYFTVNVPIQKS